MGPFSILCSHKMLGSSVICSNSTLMFSNGLRFKLVIGKIAPLGSNYRNPSSSSCISCNSFFPEPFLQHKTHSSSPSSRIVASKAKRGVNRGTTPDEQPNERKRFLLRFLQRMRLILRRIRMPHLQPVLGEKLSYLRRNSKKVIIFASISIVLGVCLLMARVVPTLSPKSMPYSDFVANLRSGVVSDVLFIEGSKGLFYNTSTDEPEGLELARECGILSRMRQSRVWKFQTSMVGRDEAFLLGIMREKGTTYRSAPMSAYRMIGISFATLMALWIPLTPIMWFYYRTMRGHGSMRKRRSTNQMVCFDDVEGVDPAKEELMEIVSCLQGSINYKKLGAKLPRGILLIGPPGTGKTLLARAVAGEACVPFFFVSASEFVEMYVGRGAARVRDLFKDARKCEPSIVFIDELDAVGGRRGGGSNDERDQTLIQLLTEMDGFETGSKVVVIAATNRPEALDPALCRPGRFSREVLVGEPDLNGRKKILAVHLRDILLDEDPELICNLVSTLTPGSVGADLANIVNEAALLAARRGGKAVTREDFMLAIERSKFGIGKLTPTAISKSLGKLFPWVQSLSKRDDPDQDATMNIRYRTLG